tara:strand:+ start:175 stop:537 length:363 start_codon:yes stop_codon:yes gene_type:complete
MNWEDILKNKEESKTSEKLSKEIEGIMTNYLDQNIQEEDFTDWREVKTDDVDDYWVEVVLDEMEDPKMNWISARAWGPEGELMIIESIRGKPISTFQNNLDEVSVPILEKLLEEVKDTFY